MRDAYVELRKIGGTAPGRKSLGRNPVVLGRRYCVGCGRWRHCCDFGPHKGSFRARCYACSRMYKRAWTKTITQEQRDRTNEYWRIWDEARRRREGIAPRKYKRRNSVVDTPERILLDPEPILRVVYFYLDDGGTVYELARTSGVSEKGIRRLMTGESQHVRIDVADKLAMAFGLHLDLLYDGEAA